MGIFLGGIVPIFVLGVAVFLLKMGAEEKISSSYHLLFAGLGLLITSGLSFLIFDDRHVTLKGASYSLTYGIGLGVGLVFISISLMKYHTPMSIISPIFSMSMLVTVLLSLIVFAEYKDLNPTRLIIGAVVILIGGALVGSS